RLISEHRQYGLTMIFSIQYLNKGVPPIFRTIATYAIVFKTNDYPSVKSLHDAFMADLGGYREVYHYIQTNTNERYTFILINCDVRAKKKIYGWQSTCRVTRCENCFLVAPSLFSVFFENSFAKQNEKSSSKKALRATK